LQTKTSFVEYRKGERKWTCIAPIVSNSTTKRSDVDHTELPANTHTSAFPSYKHSLQGDTAANSFTHLATDVLLIPCPTEGRRLSWPGWLTHWPIADALPTKCSHVNHRS